MADEPVDKAILDNVDKAANARLGDNWNRSLDGHRLNGGIQPQKMQEYLRDPDPIGALYRDGKEELLARMPSGIKASNSNSPESIQAARQAEADYVRIRQAERKAHAEMKGRR